MFGLALTFVIAAADGGAMQEVRTAKDVQAALGHPAAVFGTLRRVPMSKGPQGWEGTGLVLDDGEVVYVSYRDPPQGWAPLLGSYLKVEGDLTKQASETEQSLIAPHLVRFTQPEPARRSLGALAGARVTLSGRAANAKAGAVVMVELQPIYVKGLAAWPKEASGKEVEVTGRLRDEKLIPSPTVDSKGAVSAGAEGTQWVLESPEWRVK